MLPNFLIVGAAKAGTTAVYQYLLEHPQIFMSDPKEVNYFSAGEISDQDLYYKPYITKTLSEYERHFSKARKELAIGEGSVSYLYYPGVPERIKFQLPNAKIVIILRNPVERCFSHYLMDSRLGLVDLSIEEVFKKTSSHKNINLYFQQYFELGLYYRQVNRYFEFFDRKNVKIITQEDLRINTQEVVADLYGFLGVDSSFKSDVDRTHNTFSMPKNRVVARLYSTAILRSFVSRVLPNASREYISDHLFEKNIKPLLNSETKSELYKFYSADVQKLEALLKKDLSTWRQASEMASV